ncbi:sodium:calcium antiporter [Patescibacteria group bacterium]|nr:sodium:calcium antiporter [Patescibacteria group bacterium]
MISFLLVIFCLFSLVKSVDVFVGQASSLAKKFKVNDFIIGLTIVAFGTSLPELISAIFSSLSARNQLVMSSVIGSNITNLCLILGLIALFKNYRIRKRDVNINIPLNLTALMAFWALSSFMNYTLNWAAGISLLLIFSVLVLLSKEYNHFKSVTRDYDEFHLLHLILSLVVLIVSGKICIDQIIILASQLEISETILGYFLLSLGTSLPELVTTWVAVKRNDGELGMGNLLGSNLFNLLFVLAISTFISPVKVTNFTYDLLFLTLATFAVYAFAIIGKKYSFSRKEGAGLLVIYLLFVLFQLVRAF